MKTLLVTSFCVATLASQAVATPIYSQIRNPAVDERGVNQILHDITKGASGNTSSNTLGVTNATWESWGRLSDTMDQVWFDGTVSATFMALYWAGANQQTSPVHTFGYNYQGSNHEAFSTAGSTTWGSTFNTGVPIGINPIRLYSTRLNPDNSVANLAYSDPTFGPNTPLSSGAIDRMVTFAIPAGMELQHADPNNIGGFVNIAPVNHTRWLIFWDTGHDSDYNDFVILMDGLNPIPLPSAGLMGLAGLGLLGLRRRTR